MKNKNSLIFGFDIGTGSLGCAVKKRNCIETAVSYLINPDHGKSSKSRERRSAFRTRKAHKEREANLKKLWKHLGKKLPSKKKLEREFPKKGDETVYNSALLRIHLLERHSLEDWQIYKAIHSAIQRRGYDTEVPWKHSEKEDKDTNTKKVYEFKAILNEIIDDENYHLPCYYDAWKMGLWDEKSKKIKAIRINHHAKRARGYIPSRELIEKEIRCLLKQAEKQIPKLCNQSDLILLYGKTQKPYRSAKKIEGILNQKKPRFDNRCVNPCCLFPEYQVTRHNLLSASVTFLLGLKNFRFHDKENKEKGFTAKDIIFLYRERYQKALDILKKKKIEEAIKTFELSKTDLEKFLEKQGASLFAAKSINAPKAEGRSRYSKPALRLIKELILSGKSPVDFYEEKIKLFKSLTLEEKKKESLKEIHFEVLKQMGSSWNQIYVPNISPLKEVSPKSENNVEEIIKTCRNGVVRHRVDFFYKEFKRLVKEYGDPDEVHIEFIREDFLGEKAKEKLIKTQKKNQTENTKIREEAKEQTASEKISGKTFKKYKLWRQQSRVCIYTGESLCANKMDEYDIDHIVPRERGGNDAIYNLVLTKRHTNQKEKKKQTPYEWLINSGKWGAYKQRVLNTTGLENKKDKTKMSKKQKLLLSENAAELIEKYTHLAETAWIARLTQEVVYAHYKKQLGQKGEKKLVRVIDGDTTAALRRSHRLNHLLGEPINKDSEDWKKLSEDEKNKKIKEKIKKNRSDKRHHALDAMVLTYAGEWMRDRERDREESDHNQEESNRKNKDILLYESIDSEARASIVTQLEKLMPKTVVGTKPALGKTYYGLRKIVVDGKEEKKIVQRKNLLVLDEKKSKIFGRSSKNRKTILDPVMVKRLEDFFKENKGKSLEDTIKAFKEEFFSGKNGKSIVKTVMCQVGGSDSYKEVEKNLLDEKYEIIDRKIILDLGIVKRLEDFTKENEGKSLEDTIKAFKEEFFSGKNGKNIVKKVMCQVGGSDSYKDIAPKKKEGPCKKGQYVRDGSKSGQGTFNHGQYLAWSIKKEKVEVFSVHAFDSPKKEKEKIQSNENLEILFGGKLIKAGETILRLKKDFKRGRWDIPKGLYTLKSLKTIGQTAIESNRGVVHENFQINDLYQEIDLEIV